SGSYAGCLGFTPDGRRATGHPDSTILLWTLPLPPHRLEPFAEKKLDDLWTDLAGADSAKAWRAIWRLADFPKDALPLLRRSLKLTEPAPAESTRRLLSELDDDSFKLREAADKRLKELGLRAEPALRQPFRSAPSPEHRRRIEELLKALEEPQPLTAEQFR